MANYEFSILNFELRREEEADELEEREDGGMGDWKKDSVQRAAVRRRSRDSSLLVVAQNDRGLRQRDVKMCVILRKRSDRRIWERERGIEELNPPAGGNIQHPTSTREFATASIDTSPMLEDSWG